MEPCCQIPYLHPEYLFQSFTVEIEMCFPNQGWSWDGISAWSERDSMADAWGPKSTQNDGIKRLCWKVCLHISPQFSAASFARCTMWSTPLTFQTHLPPLLSVKSRQNKIPQFSTMSQTSLLEVNVGPHFLLYSSRRPISIPPRWWHFSRPAPCLQHTHIHTLDVMAPSLDLRIPCKPLHTISAQESSELNWMTFYCMMFGETGTFREGVGYWGAGV